MDTGQEAWRWQAKINQLLISGQCQNSGKMQFGLINFHFLSIAGERFSGGTTSTEKTSGEGRWAGCQRPRCVAAHQPLITPISPSISAQNLTHAHFIGGFSMRSRGLASVPMAGKLFARISRGCQPTWSLAETKQLSRTSNCHLWAGIIPSCLSCHDRKLVIMIESRRALSGHTQTISLPVYPGCRLI